VADLSRKREITFKRAERVKGRGSDPALAIAAPSSPIARTAGS